MTATWVRCGRCGTRLLRVTQQADGLLVWTGQICRRTPPDGTSLSPRVLRAAAAVGRPPSLSELEELDEPGPLGPAFMALVREDILRNWRPFLVSPVHLLRADCAHSLRVTTASVVAAVQRHKRKVVAQPSDRIALDDGLDVADWGTFVIDPLHLSMSAVRVAPTRSP